MSTTPEVILEIEQVLQDYNAGILTDEDVRHRILDIVIREWMT